MTTPSWPVRTGAPGIVWPAVPPPDAARLLALQFQLSQSERWPAAQLAAHQFMQLRRLLRHAVRHVPWYREHPGGSRLFDDALADRTSPDSEAWRRLPVLERGTVQQVADRLRSTAVPEGHGQPYESRSSGSTGTPIVTLATPACRLFAHAFTLRNHLWWQRDLGARLGAIRHTRGRAPYPGGARDASWGEATGTAYRTGESVLLDIATPIAEQAEWLVRERPDYLLTYPSNLGALVDHFARFGAIPPNLREVVTIGEPVTPSLREQCETHWGIRISDVYSAEEAGCIALQCPQGTGYHVQAEGVLLEVLDDVGKPCAPGETGRVVVTPLHNFAMPLVRYALGDYAEVGTPCACGRGLPTLARIAGRTRNMLVTPDGRRVWPHFGSRSLRAIAPVRQHQFVQTDGKTIEARLVVEPQLSTAQEHALREHLRSRLPFPFRITFSYPDAIERGPGGKFEDFLSLVDIVVPSNR